MEMPVLTAGRKKKIKNLLNLMKMQNERETPAFQPLIEAINIVITDDELDFILPLGTRSYTLKEISSMKNLPGEKFNDIFKSLKKKGFIKVRYNEKDEEIYSVNAIVVGWAETQIPYLKGRPEEKAFAEKMTEFLTYAKKFNFFPVKNVINATVKYRFKPNQSVGRFIETAKNKKIEIGQLAGSGESKIYPMKTVNDLILEFGKKNQIARFGCMCRHLRKQVGDTCRFNMPENSGCFGFGSHVRHFVKYGYGWMISIEEAIDIVQMTTEHGAIHAVYHDRDDASLPEVGLCNCCWDCCGLFRGYNQGLAPLKYRSYFNAEFINEARCTGCGKCAKYCPTTAIKLKGEDKNKKAVLEVKKCIGCGQCVYQCPQNILDLVQKERDVFLPIIKKSEARIQY